MREAKAQYGDSADGSQLGGVRVLDAASPGRILPRTGGESA